MNSATAPVLLWLQGGPGGSSMFGLFNEHGPFIITSDLNVLKRSTAWSMTHHLLYIDNPVGTGFSFTKLERCYAQNEDNVGTDLYDALSQFFTLFPNLKKNDFYVTGESYAGKYVPAIAHTIHTMNPQAKEKINLKGIAIGDGLCDPETMTDYGDFLFGIGLIDELDRDYFKQISEMQVKLIQEKKWAEVSSYILLFFEINYNFISKFYDMVALLFTMIFQLIFQIPRIVLCANCIQILKFLVF